MQDILRDIFLDNRRDFKALMKENTEKGYISTANIAHYYYNEIK